MAGPIPLGQALKGTKSASVSSGSGPVPLGQALAGKGTQTSGGKRRHGVLGFVENLGSDVGKAAVGLGPGLLKTGEAAGYDFVTGAKAAFTGKHPPKSHLWRDVGKPAYKAEAATWGPLTHGDVNKFLHVLYAHPLQPALDVAAVLSGGASLAEKAGAITVPRSVVLRSPAAIAGQDVGKVVTRPLHGSAGQRAIRAGVYKARQKLPYEGPLGEGRAFAKQVKRGPMQAQRKILASREKAAYDKAVHKLTNEELAALHLIGNDIHPLDVAESGRVTGKMAPSFLKVVENPKVVEAFEHPSPHLQAAVQAAKALSELDAKVKIEHDILEPGTAAARVGKHRPEVADILGKPLRGTPNEPFYVPDRITPQRVSGAVRGGSGAGRSVPKNITFKNESVLFHTGQLALHPDLLGPHFLATAKYALADDLHGTLMEHAMRISPDELRSGMLPKGWELIPKEVISKAGRKRAQQIPATIRGAQGNVRLNAELTGDLPELDRNIAARFKVTDPAHAATTEHGDYLAAPSSVIQRATGEFSRSSSAIAKFVAKPLNVWRALVLGLRVGFLTNNVVGNHLLYAIHAAGIDGLRAYLNAVRREHGNPMVKSLIQMKGMPPPLRDRFMREFFPEQVEGTLGRTQMPGPGARLQGRRGRQIRQASLGLGPAMQATAESNLRRALVETYIRRSPEFKRVYTNMPKQARDFEDAAKQVLTGEGGDEFQQRISEQVNHALGDYLNLSHTERNVIRQVVPFYSWYRAIVSITGHLAFDHPLKTAILAKLGQVGADNTLAQLQTSKQYLAGNFPIGGSGPGGQTVISTGGFNPFQTIDQLGQGLGGVLGGNPAQVGKAFSQLGPNPFLLALEEEIAGHNLFTGKALKKHHGGLPGQILAEVGTQLPQTQAVQALRGHGRQSKTYGQQTGVEALMQYLGLPVKKVQPGGG